VDNDAKVGRNRTITVSLGDQKNCRPNTLDEGPAGAARASPAVPKHKVTAPRASQHPRVRAGSARMNYAAEAQDQKRECELRNGVSMEKSKPTVVSG